MWTSLLNWEYGEKVNFKYGPSNQLQIQTTYMPNPFCIQIHDGSSGTCSAGIPTQPQHNRNTIPIQFQEVQYDSDTISMQIQYNFTGAFQHCVRKHFLHILIANRWIPDSHRMITVGEECTCDMITEQRNFALISEPRKMMWFWIHERQHELEYKDIKRETEGEERNSKQDLECIRTWKI